MNDVFTLAKTAALSTCNLQKKNKKPWKTNEQATDWGISKTPELDIGSSKGTFTPPRSLENAFPKTMKVFYNK